MVLRGVESVRSQAEVGKGSTGTGRMIGPAQSKLTISLNLISRAKPGVSVVAIFKQIQ